MDEITTNLYTAWFQNVIGGYREDGSAVHGSGRDEASLRFPIARFYR